MRIHQFMAIINIFILGNNHQSLAMVIRLRDDFAFIGVFIDVGGVFILKMQLLYTGWILGWSFTKLITENLPAFQYYHRWYQKKIRFKSRWFSGGTITLIYHLLIILNKKHCSVFALQKCVIVLSRDYRLISTPKCSVICTHPRLK